MAVCGTGSPLISTISPTQAVRTCVMYQEFDIYPQKKKYLDEELRILESTGKADAMAVLNVKRELFELDI